MRALWIVTAGLATAMPAVVLSRWPSPPAVPARTATLAVRTAAGWHEWWRADRAPARWRAPLARVTREIKWRPVSRGVQWGELTLSGSGEAWRVRTILVSIDPAHVRLSLDTTRRADGRRGLWSIDSAPPSAIVALNAGQFTSASPWGWLVQEGVERHAPGAGLLAPALVVDTSGALRLVPPDSIAAVRGHPAVREAFQSYPGLLFDDGDIPLPLRQAELGVDLDHRDARLALGLTRDGKLLVALTRFEGFGGVLSNLPFGLTTPEMAAVMGALGCSRALLLDGGLSSQLVVKPEGGAAERWSGMRQVPVGLIVAARGKD